MQMACKISAVLHAGIYFEVLYALESHFILTPISLASTHEQSLFSNLVVFECLYLDPIKFQVLKIKQQSNISPQPKA